jgi:D-alanyl-lipoteichoic acid acyltransferase DltB (MBOAT superfamily)
MMNEYGQHSWCDTFTTYDLIFISVSMICIGPIDAFNEFVTQFPIKALFSNFKTDASIKSYGNEKVESLMMNEYEQHSWCDTFTTYDLIFISVSMICIGPIDAFNEFVTQFPIKALFSNFKTDVSIRSYGNEKVESPVVI